MKKWALLSGAIIAEVIGTIALRASIDHTGWIVLVVVAYLAAFTMLGLTLRTGLPIGVVYSLWGAIGVVLTAVLGAILFKEYLSIVSMIGIGVIIIGVLLVESGSTPPESDAVVTENLEGAK